MDDIGGRIKAHSDEKWDVVDFPAIATEMDVLGRQPGEALWPERYPLEKLTQIKNQIGEYWWNSLYQQTPYARGGEIIKESWIKRYDITPQEAQFRFIFQSWDLRGEGKKDSQKTSYAVGQVWGVREGEIFLLDQVRERFDFVETLDAFIAMCKKWPRSKIKLVEDKASGRPLITVLRKKIPGIVPVEPAGDKVTRLEAVSHFFRAGNVYIPSQSKCFWAKDYIDELTSFPAGQNDDQVDATSQALAFFAERVNKKIISPMQEILQDSGKAARSSIGRGSGWSGWL